ncbi:MAG: hypothetical protein KDA79_07760 [Planctomycetaceae bacterium]|nr:hypothetical protein [Planctomycetaceae bacterium]
MTGESSTAPAQEPRPRERSLWPGWPCWVTMAVGLIVADLSALASVLEDWQPAAMAGTVLGTIYILLVPLLGQWLKPVLFFAVGFVAGCVWVPMQSVLTEKEQAAPVLAIVLLYVPFVLCLTLGELVRTALARKRNDDDGPDSQQATP